ncbi:MAG: hypothetical protein ACR2IA_01395, partial [Pyrinomonadaceae bacterium]
MNTRKFNSFLAGLTLSAFLLQMFVFNAAAQLSPRGKSENTEVSERNKSDKLLPMTLKSKISPDLEEETDKVFHNMRGDKMQKVIIQLKSETLLNEMQGNDLSESDQKQMFVQEARNNKTKTRLLVTDLAAVNGKVKKSFNNLGLVSAELPLSQIRELIKSDTVEYVSPDRAVESFGYVERVIGANQSDARSEITGFDSLNGTGVGIAVLDSG